MLVEDVLVVNVDDELALMLALLVDDLLTKKS